MKKTIDGYYIDRTGSYTLFKDKTGKMSRVKNGRKTKKPKSK